MHEFRKILDEIAYGIETAMRDTKAAWLDARKTRSIRKEPQTVRHPRSRRLSYRFSDLTTDWSCAMRFALAFALKATAILFALGGLMGPVFSGFQPTGFSPEPFDFIVGLGVVGTALVLWMAGRRVRTSAERKRYAQYQHRLLRLAREKGGSLTVVEAATDGRMTVEKAAEILSALAVGGSAEVRVSESGLVVYHLPEIERGSEKHRAKPVDDL